MAKTLGQVLKTARQRSGMTLRAVEAKTGIKNAHLSQIENDSIARPELAMLWELAVLYGEDYEELIRMAKYGNVGSESGRGRQRKTAALRALDGMSPSEQDQVLRYMAEVRGNRGSKE